MKRTFASGSPTLLVAKTCFFLIAAVVLAIAAVPPSNQAGYSETTGDFILGFRKVGSNTSILVDLGPITDLTTTRTFSLGALGPLLSTNYGGDWATSPDVYFSLAATSRPEDGTVKINYVTSPEYPADGASAKIWNRLTNTNSGILQNKIFTCGDNFNTFTVQIGTNAVVEPSTSPDTYQNYMPGGTTDAGHATTANIGWGYFNPTPEGSFKNGATGVDLVLVQLLPGAGIGNNLGKFVISADGATLTFTPVSTGTPTPSPTPSPTPTVSPTPTPTVSPTPTPGHPAFFSGEAPLGKGVFYLTFTNGNFFSYYAYLTDSHFIYHFDLGYEYVFDANDGKGGVYLYDFASSTFFYTSPSYPFPYMYDFSRNAVLYYYPDVPADGRYTHNPRYFYDLTHGRVITK